MAEPNFRTEFERELERLGLNIFDVPGLAIGPGGAEALLAHVRSLPVGATWRDVFPGWPAHWEPGRPRTWTVPYKSLGPFDYPAPPAGPAFYILWSEPGAGPEHEALVQRAVAEGWPIYGGGITPKRRAGGVDDLGFVVLPRGTSEDVLGDFEAWIRRQPGVAHTRLYRTEDEVWAP